MTQVGSAFRGLCPFHTEKTPSFYVRPQTQHLALLRLQQERLRLRLAHGARAPRLRRGAAYAGARSTGVAAARASRARPGGATARLFTDPRALRRPSTRARSGAAVGERGARLPGRAAASNDETLTTFGLGYAASGNGLLRHLERDGFSEQELQAAGVIGISDDGRHYDFFRDRVLFPIRDAQGRTIAFGGRSLEDGVNPKYLNSRDTLLFHKQETLFALDLARKPIGQERQVVIVEGYMDALMAHQHGYRNVVATLGTAVTERQLRLLRAPGRRDRAGTRRRCRGRGRQRWRALQIADESLRQGFTPVVGPNRRQQRIVPDRSVRLRIMALPGAKDPDELIRSDPASLAGSGEQTLCRL